MAGVVRGGGAGRRRGGGVPAPRRARARVSRARAPLRARAAQLRRAAALARAPARRPLSLLHEILISSTQTELFKNSVCETLPRMSFENTRESTRR